LILKDSKGNPYTVPFPKVGYVNFFFILEPEEECINNFHLADFVRFQGEHNSLMDNPEAYTIYATYNINSECYKYEPFEDIIWNGEVTSDPKILIVK
jgi:hypothetical protein